jgi:hypothetical protein
VAEIRTVNVKAYLEVAGAALVDALGKALPDTVDATGALRKSIRFTIKPYGLAYHFDLSLADYYEWVDKGRKPGKLPWDKSKGLGDAGNVILQWIVDKKFVMRNNKLERKTKGSKLKKVSDNLMLSRKVAFAIGMKIKKQGSRGTHFYSNTVPDWIENLKKELPKAYGRDILISVKEGL